MKSSTRKIAQVFSAFILLLALSGCSRTIKGDAFIVTQGRETIKLSLLKVYFMDIDIYNGIHSDIIKKEGELNDAKKTLANLSQEYDALDAKTQKIQISLNAFQESVDLLVQERNKWLADNLSITERTPLMDEAILKKATADCETKFGEKLEVLKSDLELNANRSKEMSSNISKEWRNIGNIKEELSNIYFKIPEIPNLISAKTDANGQFKISGASSEYGVFAFDKRSLGNSNELYLWFFSDKSENISLNNDNLLKANF